HRLAEIEHRLEVLGGYLVAYLNLDKVIKIIRKEDEPKPVLMKTFKLSEVQAEAILNMRLRNLRKLEEMEIRAEDKALREERTKLKSLIGSPAQQWKTIAGQIKELKNTFGPKTDLGRRRTTFGIAPAHDEAAIEEAMVVREPITVVVSEKGWIRALRGHVTDLSGVTFKTDDDLKFAFPTETTAKILIFGSNGRFYTIEASKLPGGRGHGEPVRLFIDLEDADVVAALAYQGGRKFLVASYGGNGFVVPEDDVLGTTRKGKQVLNLKSPDKATGMTTVDGELAAAIGANRKMVIFALDQVPEMGRGRGVRLQRYKEKGLSDVTTFKANGGMSWIDGAGRSFTLDMKELKDWRGNRADAGRIAPKGFPKNNKFRSLPTGGSVAEEEPFARTPAHTHHDKIVAAPFNFPQYGFVRRRLSDDRSANAHIVAVGDGNNVLQDSLFVAAVSNSPSHTAPAGSPRRNVEHRDGRLGGARERNRDLGRAPGGFGAVHRNKDAKLAVWFFLQIIARSRNNEGPIKSPGQIGNAAIKIRTSLGCRLQPDNESVIPLFGLFSDGGGARLLVHDRRHFDGRIDFLLAFLFIFDLGCGLLNRISSLFSLFDPLFSLFGFPGASF